MDRSSFQYSIVFSLLLLCFSNFNGCNGKLVGCIEREREALLHFKQGVVDYSRKLSSWENNTGEDKRDCCINWKGVECDKLTGHVIRLDLYKQSLGGKIGPSLGELQHLKHLNLSNNDFEGSLPIQLGNLSSLQFLDLSRNRFEGSLPTQLGNLSRLQSLKLGYNSEDMSCENLDWLSGLPLLRELALSGVNLSKAIHWAEAINKMPSLTELRLRNTQLPRIIYSSEAVSISNINSSSTSSLLVLDLSFNGLTSSSMGLFNFMSTNRDLVHLDLSYNNLNGSIPDAFGNISTALAYLDLSANQLESEIPKSFNNISCLVHLDLSGNQLRGSIPDAFGNSTTTLAYLDLSYNNLNGSIPDAFGNSTTTLAYLDLSFNQLQGEMPKSFTNISSLVDLDLSGNQLRGSNPDAFANMVSLQSLDLSHNYLGGEISSSLRDLCNLHYLHLSDNNLTGLLEKNFLACSNNTLEVLDLSYNRFRGTSFPQFSGFSQLSELYLGFNQLNGTLPESIGQLSQLRYLSIPSNSLQGTVSANHLFGLSNLWSLDLSFNSKLTFNISLEQVPQFQALYIRLASCKLGPLFPNWLRTQKRFMELDISASGISDVIPNWFWNLTVWNLTFSLWLNISNNNISGTLPNLTTYLLFGMDMSSNRLEGSIPQSFLNAQWLDLSNNKFSGSISLSCGNISNHLGLDGLSHLDLSSNLLSGELPQCWDQWRDLVVLNLENNNFSGEIKNSIGLLQSMRTLHLRNNSLTGALPSSLRNCTNLHLIDVGKNRLSGRIPAWIGDSLSDLIVLNLRYNEFDGSIPLNLCRLKRIQVLDLSSNNLSGNIPKCLKNFTAMAHREFSDATYVEITLTNGSPFHFYIDKTSVQWKGKELEYRTTLKFMKSIDLSSNKLIGEIPIEVTDLVELVFLNLSRNYLVGPIPATIGQLKSLDFLDLSQNGLQGEIPDSLAGITGLSVLDLSNNTLSGKIPSGTQLQSFNASSYEGNLGLCGPPLLTKCQDDKPGEVLSFGLGKKEEDSQDDANEIWFCGSIALGFIIGFWGVCGTLIFNTSWRYAYYGFLSRIKDWLYVTTVVRVNTIRRSLQS